LDLRSCTSEGREGKGERGGKRKRKRGGRGKEEGWERGKGEEGQSPSPKNLDTSLDKK